MKAFFGCLFVLIVSFPNAQTPSIMLKRLGGVEKDLVNYLQNPNALIRQSNFGLPPTIRIKRAVIDSIIAINDSSVVVVTSFKIIEGIDWTDYTYDTLSHMFSCPDSMLQKSLSYDSTGLWKPGRDLLINHKVFNAQSTCNEIIQILQNEFSLEIASQNVVFIGFDCSDPSRLKKSNKSYSLGFGVLRPKNPNYLFVTVFLTALVYFLFLNLKRNNKLPTSR
jgi:hypothetical protein